MAGPRRETPKHPIYRLVRGAWWLLAIWLSAAILVGLIRDVLAH